MKEREQFKSRIGFILLSAGCAIGIGNVWRFPYVVGENGGGIFVLFYLIFLLLIAAKAVTISLSSACLRLTLAYFPLKLKWNSIRLRMNTQLLKSSRQSPLTFSFFRISKKAPTDKTSAGASMIPIHS